ncbi:restriction endonuclease [Christensenellaceae bacterium NSJ-53]|uniref:Restriction endonuclease n=2 Tax=Gehongia tenuis TaxID=2763655 RepID=A0A926HPF1_9FIRM|nr:restriction endonuclease [Gehongia tenuis]
MAWARTFLRKYGVLENSARGVWTLTPAYARVETIDGREIARTINRLRREARAGGTSPGSGDGMSDGPMADIPAPNGATADGPAGPFGEGGPANGFGGEADLSTGELDMDAPTSWRDQLMAALMALEPAAFERLTQRLLRECGFVRVEVTGRTGDQGIDGTGIVRLNNVMSFPMVFQCKRYRDGHSVSSGEMRDFRGAMVGRTDKGLFITTSTFTKAAREEANKAGAPPIDLIDGERILDLLCELELGVRPVITYEVDETWFDNL